MKNYIHDLVHQLSEKLDSLWRYDEYIRNAKRDKCVSCVKVWQYMKGSDKECIKVLEKEITRIVKAGKFHA